MLPENPRKKNKNRISGDIKRDATGISFLLEKDGEAVEEKKISVSLHENESYIRKRCENCDDILIRPMRLGEGHKVDCLMVYIEVAVSNMMLDDSAIGKMINHFWEIPEEKIREGLGRYLRGTAGRKDPGIYSEKQSRNCGCGRTFFHGRSLRGGSFRKCGFLYGRL